MENRILCLLLLSVAFAVRPGDAQDPFTERPEETVVFVNDSAQLNCSFVTLPSFVVWQKGSEGIAVNRDVNNDLEDSYEVTGDGSQNQFHLRVIEAAVDLSGTYTCSDFGDSSITASADLIVIDGAPECSIHPGYTAVENEEITLVCMSSSVVDLAWLKDGVEVQRVRGMTHNLTTTLNKTDNGTRFDCRIVHPKLSDEQSSQLSCEEDIAVVVQYLDDVAIVEDEGSNGRVVEGGSYHATCTADGYPTPVISWMHPDGSTEAGNELHVHGATRSDAGNHTCHAVSQVWDGSSISKTGSISLDVQYKPALTTEVYGTAKHSGDSVVVLEGAPLSVACMVAEANPAVDVIEWSDVSANADGAWLNFTEISRDHGGDYTCEANNTFWDSSVGSADVTINIDVQFTPEVNIADKSNNITIEGQSYTQSCSADGNPSPDVYWQSFDGMVQNGNNLQISSISRTQQGLYTCFANSTLWDGSAAIGNDSVMVTVQYPPTITTLPSAAIKEGANVTLNCTVVEANPMMINFIWELNDGTTFTDPVVPLAGVTREFTGIHTCTATNTFYDNTQGMDSADLDLDVQYGPEISFDQQEVVCKEGESVTLQCTVDANPAPYDVHWMRDGQRIYDGTTYPLPSADRSDGGTLVCMAHNRFYDNSTAMGQENLDLVVQHPPTVSTLPSAAIKEGANVTLNCTVVEANPMMVNFTWELNDGTTFTEPVVPLAGVTRGFTGIHTCTGTNRFYDNTLGTGTADLDLDVQYGPEISFDRKEVFCKEGDSVTLQCTVDANPAPYDVHWMSGGQRIYNGTTYPLASANRSDEGTLVCMAHNRFYDNSTAMGQESLELFVQYPPMVSTLPSAAIKEGANVTLNCTVVAANPMNVSFTWRLNDGTTFTEPVVPLAGVTRKFTGIHTCTGTNTFYDNTQGIGSADLDLDVQYGPEITFDSDELRVIEGEFVTLECSVDANPAAYDVHWMRDGQTIYDGAIYPLGNAGRNDAGTFVCMAHNRFYDNSTAMGQKSLELVVEYPSTVTIALGQATVTKGSDLEMACRAETGSPDPYQLGLYQSNSSGMYEVEVVSGATSAAFKIEDADVWRSGAYSCKAKTLFFDGSELETSSVDLSVIVLSPPVILNKATEQISVSLDSEAILECIAEGSPIPKITWTDNVGEIRDALDSVDGNTITSTLTIPGISEQQLGIYLCEASNSAGRDLHGIEVVELPPPEEPSALSDGAIAGIAVGVIVFITVIVIVGILCCCQPRSAKEGNPTGTADEENTKKILVDEFTNVEDQGVENGAMPRSSPDGKDTSGEKVVETNVDETKKVEENANEIAMEPIYAKPDKTNSKKESSTADEETPPKSEGDN